MSGPARRQLKIRRAPIAAELLTAAASAAAAREGGEEAAAPGSGEGADEGGRGSADKQPQPAQDSDVDEPPTQRGTRQRASRAARASNAAFPTAAAVSRHSERRRRSAVTSTAASLPLSPAVHPSTASSARRIRVPQPSIRMKIEGEERGVEGVEREEAEEAKEEQKAVVSDGDEQTAGSARSSLSASPPPSSSSFSPSSSSPSGPPSSPAGPLRECPVYHPSAEQWLDPLAFIRSIMVECAPWGLCRLVPPSGWSPPFALDSSRFAFSTRLQNVHALQSGAPFLEGAHTYSLRQFQRLAETFKQSYFGSSAKAAATAERIEAEYWRIVTGGDEDSAYSSVQVEYGADLDSSVHGSGFESLRLKGDELINASALYAHSIGWNLRALPLLKGSLLGMLEEHVPGVCQCAAHSTAA